MAMTVPTFAQIRDRVMTDIEVSLATKGSVMGPVEYAVGMAVAGVSFLLHVAIARLGRNKVPTTAEDAVKRRWAAFFGVPPKSATYNGGTAAFPAGTGTSIPAGHALRLRNGVSFVVDSTANESGGSITVTFTATVPGVAGASSAGTEIFLGTPIPNVSTRGTVGGGGISGGTDGESTGSVFSRLLARLRRAPKGGTAADWEAWTRETAGVSVARVWPRPNTLGPSSMRVLFTVEATDPIPTGGQVSAVTAHIQTRAPADLLTVAAAAPVAQPLDPVIQLSPDTPETRDAVTAALRALTETDAVPGGTLLLSRIDEAISQAEGEADHVLVSPTANVVASSPYHLVTVGTPSYSVIP